MTSWRIIVLLLAVNYSRRAVASVAKDEPPCSLYLAPSSIPNAGHGIFAGVDFAEHELLEFGSNHGIPIVDPGEQFGGPHMALFNRLWWGRKGGMTAASRFESGATGLEHMVTLGALPNHHAVLHNMYSSDSSMEELDERNKRNGAGNDDHINSGSYSNGVGKDFYASTDIQAGQELFLFYGEGWLEPSYVVHTNDGGEEEIVLNKDPLQQVLPHIPRYRDFNRAGELLAELLQKPEYRELVSSSPQKEIVFVRKFLATLRRLALDDDSAWGDDDEGEAANQRVANLLPKTIEDWNKISIGAEPSWSVDDWTMQIAHQISVQPRTVTWLEQYGLCLDTIVPTVQDKVDASMGRGAVARRSVSEGSIVAPMPLVHVADKEVFRTFPVQPIKKDDGSIGVFRNHTVANGWQLALNYCLSHQESSLLLCPITNAALINHCSHKAGKCGPTGPNARLQWASGWDSSTDRWLNRDLLEIANTDEQRILSMEVIATRDITAGEEVFIDYGDDWQHAWSKHQSSLEKISRKGRPVSLSELNQRGLLSVETDLRSDIPLDQNSAVFSVCWYSKFYEFEEIFEEHDVDEEHEDWRELSDEEILSRYSLDANGYDGRDDTDDGIISPCLIVGRDGESFDAKYTVRIFATRSGAPSLALLPDAAPSDVHPNDPPLFITNMPRGHIQFVHKPYRSPMHDHSAAFRQHIYIPDDIFPEQWKDRANHPLGARFRIGDHIEWKFDYGHWYPARVSAVSIEYRCVVDFETGVEDHHFSEDDLQNRTPPSVGDSIIVDYDEETDDQVEREGMISEVARQFMYDLVEPSGAMINSIDESSLRPCCQTKDKHLSEIPLLPMLR